MNELSLMAFSSTRSISSSSSSLPVNPKKSTLLRCLSCEVLNLTRELLPEVKVEISAGDAAEVAVNLLIHQNARKSR